MPYQFMTFHGIELKNEVPKPRPNAKPTLEKALAAKYPWLQGGFEEEHENMKKAVGEEIQTLCEKLQVLKFLVCFTFDFVVFSR